MLKWFVMLNDGKGIPTPLAEVSDFGDATEFRTLLFDSRLQAIDAGGSNRIGFARGFEVYEWDWAPDGLAE